MQKLTCACIIFLFLLMACSCSTNSNILLPMYGRVPKTPEQVRADNNFITQSEWTFDTRQNASGYYSTWGWHYYRQGNYDFSMKRFNKAWLLDSLNCQPYWGFGALTGMRKQWNESNAFLFRAIQYGCSDALIYQSITSNYFNLFDSLQDIRYIDTAFTMTDYGLILNPYNARICNQKSICFFYYGLPDSALAWAFKAISIDPSSVSNEYLQMIEKAKQGNGGQQH